MAEEFNVRDYVNALADGDQVEWIGARGIPFGGTFIRATYAPGHKLNNVLVRVGDGVGKEKSVAVIALNRCCCKCGCTEDAACASGCSWVNIKTCSRCVRPSELGRRSSHEQ